MLLSFWRTAGAVGQGLYKAGCDLCAIGARGVSDSFRSRQIKLSISSHCLRVSTAQASTPQPQGPRLTAGALASPATRVGESTLKRTRTVQGVVLVRSAHVHTHTHMSHGGRPFRSRESRSSTHGTLRPAGARVSSYNIAVPGNHTQLGGLSPRSNTHSVHVTLCTAPL